MSKKRRGCQAEIDNGTENVSPQIKAKEKTNRMTITNEKSCGCQAEIEKGCENVSSQKKPKKSQIR